MDYSIEFRPEAIANLEKLVPSIPLVQTNGPIENHPIGAHLFPRFHNNTTFGKYATFPKKKFNGQSKKRSQQKKRSPVEQASCLLILNPATYLLANPL